MRRFLLAVFLCCSLVTRARAEAPAEAPRRDSMLLVQPFITLGGATATFEQVIDDRWTWSIGGGLTFVRSVMSASSNSQTSLLGSVTVVPGVSRFLSGRAPEGLFLGLRLPVGIAPAEVSGFAGPDARFTVGADAVVGYAIVLSNGLAAEVGFGLGVQYADVLGSAPSVPGGTLENVTLKQLSVGSRALASIGWAF